MDFGVDLEDGLPWLDPEPVEFPAVFCFLLGGLLLFYHCLLDSGFCSCNEDLWGLWLWLDWACGCGLLGGAVG